MATQLEPEAGGLGGKRPRVPCVAGLSTQDGDAGAALLTVGRCIFQSAPTKCQDCSRPSDPSGANPSQASGSSVEGDEPPGKDRLPQVLRWSGSRGRRAGMRAEGDGMLDGVSSEEGTVGALGGAGSRLGGQQELGF